MWECYLKVFGCGAWVMAKEIFEQEEEMGIGYPVTSVHSSRYGRLRALPWPRGRATDCMQMRALLHTPPPMKALVRLQQHLARLSFSSVLRRHGAQSLTPCIRVRNVTDKYPYVLLSLYIATRLQLQ